ncbi:MAG: acyl-CoA thioesterase [Flavobacterium sp.]|jgi:acyl-CoA hydrolase|uniref:acyl-CoA thioesterase n=1 Tax=Flavobacterium sp. TaxID=239 RepID=UPI001B7B2348|nr:acyl-CoA thioesterase [Flavobacterium sp.]MBP9849873.1 acyl-CoA thioesterase [Flavobacterium sp.]TAF08545.1 MAG: acyl-CoA thioesterase [Flavobacteriia bacterium]WRH73158.1 MAG: acyl-CoA thioesterase [Flavobacterium sp.]
METVNTVEASKITLSELMLPSHSNFSGKIHGGYLLKLMDQIAFACASKYSGCYCVTASVDTVDFLNPVEIGELVILKASVNYVGKTSMIVGIRVTSEHIQTGIKKHCNSSYFTMVAKDENGNNVKVPRLILSNMNEVRRFYDGVNRINNKKKHKELEINFDYKSAQSLENLKNYNVEISENLINNI